MARQRESCYYTKEALSGFSPLQEVAGEPASHLRLQVCLCTGVELQDLILVYGFQAWELVKRASATQESIHIHQPLGGQERDMRYETLLVDFTQSVHVSTVHTVQSEGFGEYGLTNKAMNSAVGSGNGSNTT